MSRPTRIENYSLAASLAAKLQHHECGWSNPLAPALLIGVPRILDLQWWWEPSHEAWGTPRYESGGAEAKCEISVQLLTFSMQKI